MDRKLEHRNIITGLMIGYDFLAVILSYFLALWIRYDCNFRDIYTPYLDYYFQTIWVYAVWCILIFALMKLYRSIWRFASYLEVMKVLLASVLSVACYGVFNSIFRVKMPVSYYIFGAAIQFGMVFGIRFSYRFLLLLKGRNASHHEKEKRIMLIGAGNAGQMILRDIKESKETNEKVCCLIDDNQNKWGRYIDNVIVYGGREKILEAVAKFQIEKIYLTLPSASAQDKRDILSICNETSCELMNLPGFYQLYRGEVTVSKTKPVQIEDLLGRDPIQPDMQEVYECISGKTVLITGVGSIGSELARQVAAKHPKALILFDIYENNAYDIQQELKKNYPDLNLHTLIGSVRDSRRIFQVFEDYRPDIVYHAAAHKHVPLMEESPCESIKNNAIGTYKTAYAAITHGCERFVLVSTDKAVNPTNIMGASKRLCEMIIQAFDSKVKDGKASEIPELFSHECNGLWKSPAVLEALQTTHTEFVAVRFGNVLGSNGSVVPLFKKQIEAGGPVTVTHPDIIRYFMTIPEAVSLVLLAGTYAKGGEIFVLDMGEPVKIDTLARNLIRLSGYTPDVDIMLTYTGLRSGEKLYEEKLMAEEGLKRTKNKLIHIGCPIPFDVEHFFGQLEELLEAACENKKDLKERVQKVVTTYHQE